MPFRAAIGLVEELVGAPAGCYKDGKDDTRGYWADPSHHGRYRYVGVHSGMMTGYQTHLLVAQEEEAGGACRLAGRCRVEWHTAYGQKAVLVMCCCDHRRLRRKGSLFLQEVTAIRALKIQADGTTGVYRTPGGTSGLQHPPHIIRCSAGIDTALTLSPTINMRVCE